MNFEQLAATHQVSALHGRYIHLGMIEPILKQYDVKVVGTSVLKQPIYAHTIGHGATRILMWSQMHGNESTTTKALFDFFDFMNSDSDIAKQWSEHFTFLCLPMLNPDGAKAYTRENANNIDLNRDAQDLSQPESRVLRECFERFEPHYCYNLHDQRTIYGTENSGKPATVSFLAPAYNSARDINEIRVKAMNVIVAMNDTLQQLIPGQVGRFDDGFNLNCVGDTFQWLKVPTILFEAGHFPEDYDRDMTRRYIFIALLSGLKYIYENVVVHNKTDDYLNIPQNKVVFFDIVYKNVKINYDGIKKNTNFAVQFNEELIDNQVRFNGYFAQIGSLEHFFGHSEIDAHGEIYSDDDEDIPKLNAKADFCLGKNNKIVNGVPKK